MERIKNAKGNCRHGMSHPNYQLAYFNSDILLFLLIGYGVIVLPLRRNRLVFTCKNNS